ncbi:MAG TPA: alpha/beta fold hydrolase [Bdellovibrionota bacterium]|jgi:alpha-beta hydrolase superfamily lysophospholipase|nr:alpha/beta fold hydrolase [Bdellovibrionota bacterium]
MKKTLLNILIAFSATTITSAFAKDRVTLPTKDGHHIYGEFYRAKKPRAIMLVVHGLQSHVGWYQSGDINAEAGISSFAFDRRGSGRSDGERGHTANVDEFMEDFQTAMNFVKANNPDKLPVHIMANSLGAVTSLQYLNRHPNPQNIASLILTTPGTHSTSAGDYPLFRKLRILLAPAKEYFETPLENKDFVEEGPFLDWINNDKLGNRFFTASFLRTVNSMKGDFDKILKKVDVPLFALMAKQDDIIDNAKFEKKIFKPYRGPKLIHYYDSKHYLFFGADRELVLRDIQNWVLRH